MTLPEVLEESGELAAAQVEVGGGLDLAVVRYDDYEGLFPGFVSEVMDDLGVRLAFPCAHDRREHELHTLETVSHTHLTLPTKRIV